MQRNKLVTATLLALIFTECAAAQSESAPATRRRDRSRTAAAADLTGSVQYGEIASKVLGTGIRYGAYLPPGYEDAANANVRYPVVFYLHGMYEDPDRWFGRHGGRMFDTAIKEKSLPPMIVIVPDAAQTFYLDSADGKRPYARFFIEEMVPWADKTFRTTGKREQRILWGHSMGGFGALRFAMKHPDLFSACVVHSAAILPENPDDASPRTRRAMGRMRQVGILESLFGDPIDTERWKASNPLCLAATVKFEPPVAFYFDCGDQDSYQFDDGCRALDEVLTTRKIPHTSAIRPGGHGWEFIRSAFPHAAEFIAKHLKPSKS